MADQAGDGQCTATGGKAARVSQPVDTRLSAQIAKQPDTTVNEMREWLQQQEGAGISQQRLSAVIFEMGLRVKKKSVRQ